MKRSCSLLLLALLLAQRSPAQAYLTPLDFGLKPLPHGRIDYTHTPPNILLGNFNSDCYPDIARFEGDKLEIYILEAGGYPARPQLERHFSKPIKSLRLDGSLWDTRQNLVVTLQDGSEETFYQRGCLDLRENEGFLPEPPAKLMPPRQVSDYDFQLVWESDGRPCGMNHVVVGDLDNDGINELVTWWKEFENADSAWILIYKCIRDNQYELFMEDPFSVLTPTGIPGINYMLIADLDQNGQKELIYTYERVYVWEFSAPGVYSRWNTNYIYYRLVAHAEICDVDQDARPEIALLAVDPEDPQPSIYFVKEFLEKSCTPDSEYLFTNIMGLSQYWLDGNFSVGDFDNDGATDIVSGNYGYVIGYYPVDIQFFRYSPGFPNSFVQYWLQTGLPLSCATPVIADLDNDGTNEMFAGGLSPGIEGSAFIWEPTGLGTGYASWIDTTSMYFGPNESQNGIVDWNPAVISLINDGASGELHLFGLQDAQFAQRWASAMPESTTCGQPAFLDMDQDGKMDLCMGGTRGLGLPNRALDWEQISSWTRSNRPPVLTDNFHLFSIYPNPFNHFAKIPFQIAKPCDISLRIYDIYGRIAYQDFQAHLDPGGHVLNWQAGAQPSGVYVYRLTADNFSASGKMVLMK